MMRRLVSVVLVAALAHPVAAGPRTILVLPGEGRVDAATRAKVDASLIELARTTSAQVQPGDLTFADAAAAIGCQPQERACRDEVLEMLAVDELVYATLTPKPGGIEVRVHRVTKGNLREAQALVVTGQSADLLAPVAPLFGGRAPAERPALVAATDRRPPDPTPVVDAPVSSAAPTPTPTPTPTLEQPQAAAPMTQPTDTTHPPSSKLPTIGMIGGGAMVMISFMLWGQASEIRDQIDKAPTNTLAQLQTLAELESRGDSYAGWGNLMFLGGAVLGGVSTYYFLKNRRRARATTTARITPAVFDHGAGVVFTLGGTP